MQQGHLEIKYQPTKTKVSDVMRATLDCHAAGCDHAACDCPPAQRTAECRARIVEHMRVDLQGNRVEEAASAGLQRDPCSGSW
eukprot:5710469-Amphidinium_carterae.1